MKRKMLVTLLTMAMTVTMVAGCGKHDEKAKGAINVETAAKTEKETQVETEAEEKEEQIVLKWYTESDEATNKNYAWDNVVAAYEKLHPNVKIEVQPLVANTSSAEYLKKVDLMLASDEQIDIINFAGSGSVAQKVEAGVLEPLDEYAKVAGVDLEAEYRGISRIDDQIYCLPNSDAAYIVFINEDMLKEANLEIPPRDWTWEEYAEYAKAMTKGEGRDKIYGSYFHTWSDFYQIGTLGVIPDNTYYKPDGSANFDHPALRTWMEFIDKIENKDNYQMSYIDIKTQNIAYRNLFFNGKVAMLPMGTWMLSDIKDVEKYPHTFRTVFATLPRFDKNAAANTTINTAFGGGYAINANCKHKQEAFDFIRFLTSEGFNISKSFLSPWVKGDHEGIAAAIMGEDTSLYDMESYIAVMQDPEIIYNNKITVKSTDAEIDEILLEEVEMFLTGGQTVDEMMTSLQKRAQEVIDKSVK